MGSQASGDKSKDTPSALGHLRVLDLAGPEGQYCGKVLADLGADVIKLEPPEGDPSRGLAPFAGDTRQSEASLNFINYNANKRSLVLDLTSKDGPELLRRLVATADVLVESFAPSYLDSLGLGFRRLSRINPALVMTSVTPFGQSGPYRRFLGSELVAQAMGGLMYIQGDDTRAPCAAPCDQASQLACLHACCGILAALRHRGQTGLGQHVDVSMQDVVSHLLFTLSRYAHSGEIVRRTGMASTLSPSNYYPCQDGYVCLCVFFNHHWLSLVDWMGSEALADPVWLDVDFRRSNPDVADQFVAEFVRDFTVQEFIEQGRSRHLAVSPMNTMEAVLDSPQVKAREYLVRVNHPHIGEHLYPGAPYRFSRTPWKVRRPAPLQDQHRAEIIEEINNIPPLRPQKALGRKRRGKAAPPLKGVRIVDFTRVWAGPFATRYLADLGAEVIRIETSDYLDVGRLRLVSGPIFPETNRGKLGVTLNFRSPEGLDLARRLVAVSDVVIENYAAGVMERRGLGYESLKEVRPDVVMLSMPGYGNTGPLSDQVAYGQNLMAYSGLSFLWGHPDSPREARPKVHYADFMSAAIGGTAVLAALEYRSQTGHGQYIELAQAESLASTMGVAHLDYLVNGRAWQPMGNRSLNAAPSGCYPCRGDDQWCVISCLNDDQWSRLCGEMGNPPWTQATAFGSLASRIVNHDELDERISQWTNQYTPYQVMRRLQRAGVPAGAVQSGEQLYHDHHLRSRGFIVELDHGSSGKMEHPGSTVGLSGTPGRIEMGASDLGQHNSHVFGDLLGTGREALARLVDAKVID